ncbi:hypothetical protein BLOT_001817 [Blomia tropicalis]|nr:hypothetical protein BLOT_001817 [Blomia tropicalis]
MALCLSRLFFNSSLIRIVLSVGAAIRNSVSNREILASRQSLPFCLRNQFALHHGRGWLTFEAFFAWIR